MEASPSQLRRRRAATGLDGSRDRPHQYVHPTLQNAFHFGEEADYLAGSITAGGGDKQMPSVNAVSPVGATDDTLLVPILLGEPGSL